MKQIHAILFTLLISACSGGGDGLTLAPPPGEAPCENCEPPPPPPPVPVDCTPCDERMRTCSADGDCGGCVEGFEEAGEACVPIDEGCRDDQTVHVETGACVDCGPCDAEGSTGYLWPVTDRNGGCVCETRPGYYFDDSPSSRVAVACDADGDGWVKRSAFNYVNATDDAIRINARCDVRHIDRFVLENELGQRHEITVSALGGSGTVALYETDDNDEPIGGFGYVYGEGVPRPSELNPLTKLCADRTADFNDNRIADLTEWDRVPLSEGRAWMSVFTQMGHFVELHTSRFEAGEDRVGRYVISERRRCDDGFPLGYADGAGGYWRSCARRRAASFSAGHTVAHDFARYGCEASDGSCPAVLLTDGSTVAGTVPAHGVCELGAVVDGPFRGMNHHSQFRCAELVGKDATPTPSQLSVDEIWPTTGAPRYDFNVCGLDDGALLACETTTSSSSNEAIGRVGFFAARFEAYGPEDDADDYTRGCVDEGTEWPTLCPGYDPNRPDGVLQDGLVGNFGRLMCGCDYNYGGAACEIGCPSSQLHLGGDCADDPSGYCRAVVDADGQSGGRRGVWMCGRPSATIRTSSTTCAPGDCGPGLSGRGRVSFVGRTRSEMFSGTGEACDAATPCTDPTEDCVEGQCRVRGGFRLR